MEQSLFYSESMFHDVTSADVDGITYECDGTIFGLDSLKEIYSEGNWK